MSDATPERKIAVITQDMFSRVIDDGEEYVVTKNSKPVAVVVSYERYSELVEGVTERSES